jgi:hypothetical protein
MFSGLAMMGLRNSLQWPARMPKAFSITLLERDNLLNINKI